MVKLLYGIDAHIRREELDTIKIMICDDEEYFRNLMLQFINDYQEQRGEIFKISVCDDGSSVIEDSEEYDLYFLDIEMKITGGVKAAQEVLSCYPLAEIVFFTSHRKYTDDALRLKISGYIDKPFDRDRVFCILDRMMPVIRKKNDTVCLRKENDDMANISIYDIIYIKTERKRVYAMTRKGLMRYMGKYSQLSKIIENHEFMKIREKCMVNMQFIKTIKDRSVVLCCGKVDYTEDISKSVSVNGLKLMWLDYKRRTVIDE